MRKPGGRIDSKILLAADAALAETVDLFSDVATARWSIDRNLVRYERTDSHTLSLYLKGGDTSCRADRAGEMGGTGKLCMMPEGHKSDWQICGPIDFAHVYFTDALLKRHAALNFDCDARQVELTDMVYGDDPTLRQLMLDFMAAYAGTAGGVMLAEERLAALLDHLVRHYNAFVLKETPLKGGLSPHHRRQILAAIYGDLSDKLTLNQLADMVGLSPFHFTRMFKLSFGMGPARFILGVRLDRAKALLATDMPLAAIAHETGFAQQSHLTEQFRKLIGLTPARYRAALAS